MSIIQRETRNQKVRFFSKTPVIDAAGNTFEAAIWNDGGEASTVIHVYKRTPAGQETLIATIRSDAGKLDDCGMAQSGPHLLIRASAHEGDFTTNRQAHAVYNVATPYPAGHVQLAAPGAHMPTGEPTPPGNYPTVAEIAVGVLAVLEERMGPQDLRGDFEAKVKDALIELMDYNHDAKSRAYLDRMAPFFRDRCYEALLAYHGPRNADDEDTLDALAKESG